MDWFSGFDTPNPMHPDLHIHVLTVFFRDFNLNPRWADPDPLKANYLNLFLSQLDPKNTQSFATFLIECVKPGADARSDHAADRVGPHGPADRGSAPARSRRGPGATGDGHPAHARDAGASYSSEVRRRGGPARAVVPHARPAEGLRPQVFQLRSPHQRHGQNGPARQIAWRWWIRSAACLA